MPLKSSPTQYGAVAVSLHWVTALLIIATLGSGFRAANTGDPAAKIDILAIHASLAITVVAFTLARIMWWWFADEKPAPIANTPNWQHISARVVHLLFYVVILGMAASGIGMLILSSTGQIIFGGLEAKLPNFWDYKPRVPHGIGARIMVALFLFHAGAALYHHVIRRDGLLWRMWYTKA